MAIVGPSGCGKSTLLKLVAGINIESDGNIFWEERDLSEDGDLEPSEIGYVPQFSIAYENLTIEENIESAVRLRVKTRGRDEFYDLVDKVLMQTGMEPIRSRPVKVLSGGQKRRLSLALELVTEPVLLLADEVTSGLDPKSENEIVKLLHQLSRKQNRIVMNVTHSLANLEFPMFLVAQLPAGVSGLVVAALFAAAMSTVSISLNSSATLIMNDFYKRFLNPEASEKSAMNSLYLGTIAWGMLGTTLALYLVKVTNSALDIWWALSGIIGGAMTGLFLLGLVNKLATSRSAIISTLAGVIAITWISWPKITSLFGSSATPFLNIQMAPAIGVLVTLIVGFIFSTLSRKTRPL